MNTWCKATIKGTATTSGHRQWAGSHTGCPLPQRVVEEIVVSKVNEMIGFYQKHFRMGDLDGPSPTPARIKEIKKERKRMAEQVVIFYARKYDPSDNGHGHFSNYDEAVSTLRAPLASLGVNQRMRRLLLRTWCGTIGIS